MFEHEWLFALLVLACTTVVPVLAVLTRNWQVTDDVRAAHAAAEAHGPDGWLPIPGAAWLAPIERAQLVTDMDSAGRGDRGARHHA